MQWRMEDIHNTIIVHAHFYNSISREESLDMALCVEPFSS